MTVQEFVLPLSIKGKELNLNARLLRTGYTYTIEVDIDDTKVHFERDEEGEWRALVTEEELARNKNVKKELLASIAECIDLIAS